MNSIVSKSASSSASFNIEPLDSAPNLFLHCALFLPGKRIISDETFRLETFQGKESVSTLFEYELELHANSCEAGGNSFTFDEILGCPITVGIQYPDLPDTENGADSPSFNAVINGEATGPDLVVFNGIVSSFSIKNRGTYQITMKPALHRLALTNHYKIYTQKNICDVIKILLDAQQISYAPFTFSPNNLAMIRTQDWLQTGETDFDFLQRLLAKAHLYFYFRHTANGHTLVFSNHASYDPVFSSNRSLRYDFTNIDALGLAQCDIISEYSYNKTLNSSGVSGVLTQQGEAWQDNHIVPYVSYQADDSPSVGALPFNLYKSYQYGGSIHEVKDIVDAVKSTIASASCILTGSSYCAYFKTAHTFTLINANTSGTDTNPAQANLEREPFVLTMVSHSANADGTYQNQFQATSAKNLITPYSIQETQQGSLLAIVVAHASTSVQDPTHFGALSSFDPENNQFLDAMNSNPAFQQKGVFVTFSTDPSGTTPIWVKISASMQSVPTIGAIVQVAKAQDESELPEIQNIIQTNGSMQVIPAGWLANTHVGSSFSTNYGNSKSINYGAASNADLQQATGIVNTAYDSGRFDSVGFTQGTNYSFSCADSLAAGASHSNSELYGTLPVASDILSASESFGSTYSRQHANTTRNFSTVINSINISDAAFTTQIANTGVTTNITNSGVTANTVTSGATTNITTTGLTFNTTISGLTKNITVSGDTWNTSTVGNTVDVSFAGNTVRTSTSGLLTETTTTGNIIRTTITGNLTDTSTTGDTIKNTISGDIYDNVISAGVTRNYVKGIEVVTDTSASTTNTKTGGDTNNITTSGMTSNVTTTAATNTVETTGPGAKVSTNDAQPHVDNIITRVTMVEGLLTFM